MTRSAYPPYLPPFVLDKAVSEALAEDVGRAGDITTLATLSPDARAKADMATRQDGVVCGLDIAATAFRLSGHDLVFSTRLRDGDTVTKGDAVATISGNARALMTGERVALNFMNHLSGIATLTRRFVEAIDGTGAAICDTRKTTPGLRAFEKYAVRCGGGSNHRYGLDDAVLIKDNHIAVAGGVTKAIEAARAYVGHMVIIEIEVDTLDQLSEALDAGATAVLLDNMEPDTLARAVALNKGRAKLEASGGVTLERVRAIAETGVDYISTSQITMGATPLDIGLDISIS